MEASASVWEGADFTNGWAWQQDVQSTLFVLNDTATAWNVHPDNVKAFTPNALAVGGNDSGTSETTGIDSIPDLNREIFSADSPAITPDVGESLPVGTVAHHSLYARLWLTWNGGVVSEPIKWRSVVKIHKYTEGSWEYLPGNLIGATAPDDPETPNTAD